MNSQHINISLSFNQVIDIVKQLSPNEKLRLKKVLQGEETNSDTIDIPEEHQKLVMDRFEKVRKNPERLLDWDETKKTLKG
jgi:hypothetical protein